MVKKQKKVSEDKLESSLQKIIQDRYYKQSNWSEILPLIITKLQQYESYEEIKPQVIKLVDHLNNYFHESPPFTILRLSELLIDPTKQGYKLDNERNIKKYINSLSSVIVVSSTVKDFPDPEPKTDVKEPYEDIPLIKIPWLEEAKAKEKAKKLKQTKGDSTPDKRLSDSEEPPHKRNKPDDSIDSSIDSSPVRGDSDMETSDINGSESPNQE
ncbi:hypothetical protein CLIB1444_07S02256 [[Candida] jaroonii]|uniref:Uncharacterized protein n=1 Tax=[Candida] jaroonii TaxID=467808 RepID=A0ACA9YA51_9ASCO|nr:hypothetical protein CLIB1444_07S02256 [[Candida] jaroonii]